MFGVAEALALPARSEPSNNIVVDSQIYPSVCPRQPDDALFPTGGRSIGVDHVHLGQEKRHKTCLESARQKPAIRREQLDLQML